MLEQTTNIIIAGLGGQGVLTSANIISYAAFLAGFDVKESEVHGMSQRGGSVSSDVRYGSKIYSPMISAGEADFILLFSDTESDRMSHYLRADTGKILRSSSIDSKVLPIPAVINTAVIGVLSKYTKIEKLYWEEAIKNFVPSNYLNENLEALTIGMKL